MSPDKLIASIEEAFPEYPVPDVTLRQRVITDEGMSRAISDDEWESAGKADRDLTWTRLSDKDLMDCEDGIAHLTKVEFAYYLGAFLRFAVRHLNSSSPERHLVSVILFYLTDEPPASLLTHVHSRWGSLNRQQTEVVRRFLKYIVSHSEKYGPKANRALAQYWEKADEK